MQIERLGLIINTENYTACVDFYRTLLDAEVLFKAEDEHSHLTCLRFGIGYLMIETEGLARADGKGIADCPHKIRLNVDDVEAAARKLAEMGITAEVVSYPWGTVINTHDPDGNRVGIRDEAGFARQMEGYAKQ